MEWVFNYSRCIEGAIVMGNIVNYFMSCSLEFVLAFPLFTKVSLQLGAHILQRQGCNSMYQEEPCEQMDFKLQSTRH